MFKYNVGKEEEFNKISNELGVDSLRLKRITLGRTEEHEQAYMEQYMPEDENMQRSKGKLFRDANVCPQIIRTATILWDGRMVPCCYDSDANDPLGNVLEEGFYNVFYGKKRAKSIKDIIYHKNKICFRCDGAE